MIPEVAVVLPTWNRAQCIDESLESLLAQDGVAFEVIVVDDGSTDDTVRRVAARDDPRVRLLERPHAGVAAARNAGVAAAGTPFIAFHDSDDLALPGRLAIPVAYLRERPEVDLVMQNGRMLAGEGEPEAPWVAPEVAHTLAGRSIGWAEVFRWNLGQLQGMCFTRRSLLAAGPFDTSLRILDDLDLVLRVTVRGPAVFLDRPAFAYRRHASGLARDRRTVREESIRVADKLVAAHPELLAVLGRASFARRQARRWARLARLRAREGDVTGARAALAEARRLRPVNLEYRLRAFLLAHGPRR